MSTARRGDDGGGPPSEGATLIVHVVADGVPLAGARLFVDGALRATSDESGTVTVRGLTLGLHHGWLLAEGRADERIDVAVHEDPEAVHERFVTLAPGCMIEGRVVDERGAPVANAWVSVITNDGRLCYQTRSSAAGHWRVSVRAGAYRAHASIGGPWSPLVDFACEGHVGWWALHRRDHGSRLEQAFESRYESTSDAAGAYLFDGIEPGRLPQRPAHLWATHPARGASILRELADSDPTIDLVLVATGHIEVVVDGLGGGRAVARAIRADEPPRARTSSIGRDGRCRFESVPAGEYVLQLDLGDLDPVAPVTVTVRGGDTATARLVMTTPTVRLTIRVPDGRGNDLVLEPTSEGARVGGRLRGIVAMGNEDRCRFELVRPGSYRASLDRTRWHPIVVTEDPGEQTIDLRSA